ncbi:beta-alanine-activating enzyme-like isoform X2 [Watersipora subatra]|uniref:beta-alanine-activating enzyme-like isoform X2 n=1 Tax=Watersipora subatra TaxID=2589382 RepID=UPI00355AF714
MPSSSRCETCDQRRALVLDRDLQIDVILNNIKRCLKDCIPFIPIDLSTSAWRTWIKRIPYCVTLATVTQNGETNPDYRFNCQPSCGTKQRMDARQTLSKDQLDREDILYIVTTSGTARPLPRVVYATKSSVQPNIDDLRSRMKITFDSVIYCSSPITFDPAILMLLISIHTGAQLVHHEVGAKEPLKLLDFLRDKMVTHIQTVPSFLRLLNLDLVAKHLLIDDTSVRVVSMGGEPCLTGKELYRMSGGSEKMISKVNFFNLYGLTEQSVWSSMHHISPATILSQSEEPVPIGKALSETEMTLEDCKKGEGATSSGSCTYELTLRSKTRLCYIDDGSSHLLTSLQLPTGDLFNSDMLFQGRKDVDFVKIGGTRISLLALSQSALEVYGVKQAYCLCDSRFGLAVVYVGSAAATNVEQALSTVSLYPGSITAIKMERLPIDRHGKIDRQALLAHLEQEFLLNSDKVAQQVKDLLPATMQRDKTFIENGGTSIQALALASQLSTILSAERNEHMILQMILSKSLKELFTFIDTDLYKLRNTSADSDDSGPTKKARVTNIVNSPPKNTLRAPATYATPLSLCWKVDTGKCVDASPVSAITSDGEVIFIGSHSHKFFSLRLEDGSVLWSATLGDRIEATATVSLEHNHVYVGCYDNYLYCLNMSNGGIVYKHRAEDIIKSSPVIDSRGFLYFGSHDYHIYCLNQFTFASEWKRKLDGAVYATPLLSGSNLYVVTLAGSLYAIDKVTGGVVDSVKQGFPMFSSPKICSAQLVVCGVDGLCVCRSLSDLQMNPTDTGGWV